ncbi:MAG TPA: hypothetical protein VFM18_09645, partial [Methanosarcina sp.]|nr:hypothetical protein [Methanosarcina sp.]
GYTLGYVKKAIVKAKIHTLALRFCRVDEESNSILLPGSIEKFKKDMRFTRKASNRFLGVCSLAMIASSGFHWLVVLGVAVFYAVNESYHLALISLISNNPKLLMELKDK